MFRAPNTIHSNLNSSLNSAEYKHYILQVSVLLIFFKMLRA